MFSKVNDPVFTPGKWIIAFFDGGRRHLWDLFTRKGYRHCFAVRYLDPIDAWVIVDWANEGLTIDILPKRFVDAMIVGVNNVGGSFLEVYVTKLNRRIFPFQPLYCVSAIKDLVGLRDWRVITPWQLYCALRKRGAQPMFDLSDIKENTDGKSICQTEIASS